MKGAPKVVCPESTVELDAVVIGGKEVAVLITAKLLGLTISTNLTWNGHIEEVVKKASKLPPTHLILVYNTSVRSVIDYAVRVLYDALPPYLINELVGIEKRAMSIIMPGKNYKIACECLGETPIKHPWLRDHINSLCDKLFCGESLWPLCHGFE